MNANEPEIGWEEARTFLTVAREGSLAGAAKALGVHHSTVFRRLSRLEAAVGAALFERIGGRYRPTAAGEAFATHAQRVQDELFAMQRAVLGSTLMPAGTLRLTTLGDLLPWVLPALAALEASCPELTIELDATTELRDLDRRDADMALRPSEAPPGEAVGRRIAPLAWAMYAPRESRRARKRLRYVGPLSGRASPRLAEEAAAGTDTREPARIRVRTVAAMVASIAEGFGVGALPCYVGDREPRVRRMGEAVVAPRSALWLLMHPDLERQRAHPRRGRSAGAESAAARRGVRGSREGLTPHCAPMRGATRMWIDLRQTHPVALLVGDSLCFAEAELTLTAGEDGVRWHVAFSDEGLGELELIAGPGGARGHLRTEDGVAPLFDEVQLVKRSFSTDQGEWELVGLEGEHSFAHHGPFRRLRTVFVGVQDEAVIEALATAWAPEQHDTVARLPWTLESLTRFCAAHARSLDGVDEVAATAPGQLTLRRGENVQHVDLHNLFPNVQHAPDKAMKRIEDFFAAMTPPPSGPISNGDVMFRVMGAPAPVQLRVDAGSEICELELASFGVGDELSAVFVRDTPRSMAFLQSSEVEGLAPSAEALMELAGENLLRSLPAIHIRGEAPLFMIIAGGDYECSLALLPAFWEAMASLLDGAPLVAMPARDLCFVIPDEPSIKAQLREHIDSLGELAYPVSPCIYRVLHQGRWFEAVG